MNERLKHMGRLQEKILASESLCLQIQGLSNSIRDIMDPFEAVADLKIPVAFEQMSEMASKHIEYLGLLSEIRAIKKALGK